MSTTCTIEEKVKDIIAKMFNANAKSMDRDTQLVKDLLAKSMNFMELQALLESEFGVDLASQSVMRAKTVGDFVDLVSNAK
jgi:acyl carrier protein